MEPVRLILKNYRCFSSASPFDIVLAPGITAFVGPNNAGKTAALYALRDSQSLFGEFVVPSTTVVLDDRTNTPQNERWYYHSNEEPLFIEATSANVVNESHHVTRIAITYERSGVRSAQVFANAVGELRGQHVVQNWAYRSPSLPHFVAVDQVIAPAIYGLQSRVFIPSFRTPLTSANGTVLDFPVGQSLVTQWSEWKGGDSIQQTRAAAAIEEDIRRIFGFQSLSIATRTQNSGFRLVIDGKHLNLDEVGSGVAHVMMAMMAVALRRPNWVLVDEPETGMHPTLQIEYIAALRRYCVHGIVMATHSLGLARAVADRIYAITRSREATGTESSAIAPYGVRGTLQELLGAAGYAAYRQSGSNLIIWVEGPHDVLVLRRWYRLLGGERSPLILPLHGDNGINEKGSDAILQLKESLDAHVYAIIDSERDSQQAQPNQSRMLFKKSLETHGIPCHIVERRATESYFVDSAIKAAVGSGARALSTYERHPGKKYCGFSKADGVRIADAMRVSDIYDTDVGGFLSRLIRETSS
ncbi:MAG TPA: AAA family ATPase [Phycisphaerales bacterium]|nr:AAA family ATPase [Phycisphaerales bacterium]